MKPIRADRYAAAAFARIPEDRRLAIEAAIPPDHWLSLTHGGRVYRASLYAPDGELVDAMQMFDLEAACERVLSRVAA